MENGMKPIIALNFKVYQESLGSNGLKLLQIINKIAREFPPIEFIVCPALFDLSLFASEKKSSNVKIFAQHSDLNELGKGTGSLPLSALKLLNVNGTMINHAEKSVSIQTEQETIEKALKENVEVMGIVDSVEKAELFASLSPQMIAIELPELIGSGRSISQVNPTIVSNAVQAVKKINPMVKVLAGAGISEPIDFEKSLELGANGVLLASGFVLAKNPEDWLRKMAEAGK